MADVETSKSIIEKDPKQFEWAVRDLDEFATMPWNGNDALISRDILMRTRQAASLILQVIQSGELIEAQPVKEALGIAKEDNEGYLKRIDELKTNNSQLQSEIVGVAEKQNTQLQEYKDGYQELRSGVTTAIDELDCFEVYGSSDNPVASVVDGLVNSLEQADATASYKD